MSHHPVPVCPKAIERMQEQRDAALALVASLTEALQAQRKRSAWLTFDKGVLMQREEELRLALENSLPVLQKDLETCQRDFGDESWATIRKKERFEKVRSALVGLPQGLAQPDGRLNESTSTIDQ